MSYFVNLFMLFFCFKQFKLKIKQKVTLNKTFDTFFGQNTVYMEHKVK